MKYTLSLFLILPLFLQAQINQTVRGTIRDKDTRATLVGASVVLIGDSSITLGAVSDIDGNYTLENVPVGRHSFEFSSLGYQSRLVDDVSVISSRETILDIELSESSYDLGEAEITATRKGEVMNEMATVSARQFSVAETDRYAGSRGDPARMASNFAGVQGADDSRNDIVVRGNSPQGVLWRVEGIDIPNPNHFAIPGTSGGPVAILNNKILSNSDFYTGAFPAEFGNSIAGIFDLRLRNGNTNKFEFTGQLGFLGTELLAEGPLNKKHKSSFLVSYRYSTISLFKKLGIDIGTSAEPKYQDGFFRLFFPAKNGGTFALWGLGGLSGVDILISDQTEPERNIFGENDRDQYYKTRMGLIGLTYSKPINEAAYLKTTFAYAYDEQDSHHDFVYRHLNTEEMYVVDSLTNMMNYNFRQSKVSNSTFLNYKLNPKNLIKAGFNIDYLMWAHQDSIINLDTASVAFDSWSPRWNSDESSLLLQPYVQWKWKPNQKWTVNLGLHSQYLAMNNSLSVLEPRLGIKWKLKDSQSLSFGAGMHSQMQSAYLYFYQPYQNENGEYQQHNRDVGFTKSNHLVLAYDCLIGKNFRFKTETYYQQLSEVPVEQNESSFSLVNTGAGFSRFFADTLENTGSGYNYGIEFTLEKFFNNSYFFMITASLFESKYKGSDGVERNTDFNGRYAVNFLLSKEWKLNKNSSILTGTKITMAGGRWYGPVDFEASNELKEIIYVSESRNTQQLDDYFRADLKINYKVNRPKVSHEVGLDLVNVTNQKNVLKLTYAPDESNDPEKSVREEYQLGLLPVFFYRIDF